jgi:cytoskeletal protein RodZ
METFGQKLRHAIDRQGLRLEEVARATGFGVHQLEALERDDYGALPDDDFMTEHLQVFARLVEVDPQLVVGDYLSERERHRGGEPGGPQVAVEHAAPRVSEVTDAPAAAVGQDVPRASEVVRAPAAGRSAAKPGLLAFGLAAAALLVAGFLWLRFPEPRREGPAGGQPGATAPVAERATGASGAGPASPGEAEPPVGAAPAIEPAKPESARGLTAGTADPAPSSRLEQARTASGPTVRHRGVGTGVVDHALVGESDRFAEGTQVFFWTQVEGATPGEAIRHVWIHEGREVVRVPLRIGAARWRTHSFKSLHPGSAGGWVVEARDEAGRVLARASFRCSPPAAG